MIRTVAPTLLATLVLCLGCGAEAGGAEEDELAQAAVADPPSAPAHEMSGFSYLRDFLAGMPRPGGRGDLDADLDFLASEDITLLVSLTPEALDEAALAARNIEVLRLPVEDFHAPTQDQLHEFIARTQSATAAGHKVGVHCTAGIGRTGTFLSAWVISEGNSARDAITEVRALRPGSVETASQEAALAEFAESYVEGLSKD